jgi:hypothetical protein
MQTKLLIYVLFILSVFQKPAIAQTEGILTQDARGRYSFSHTTEVPDATKEALYERLKSFVVTYLNASDTYIVWDEANHDSVKTIAYIELANSPEMRNQVIDCKARLDFKEGSVTLSMSGFNYGGTMVSTDASYAKALHRMDPLPDASQSWARIALAETLRLLCERMDQMAAGKMGKRGTTRARTRAKQR